MEETLENNNIETYTKEIELPSNGYLGGPKKVVIRAMTTAEEKILFSAKDFSFIKKVCRACCVSPVKLDTSKILPQDLFFMIYQIRELTFGPSYLQPVRCPQCGLRQDAVINITDFEYKLLNDDLSSKLFIELPISKAKVHLKLLSQDAIDSIEESSKRLFFDGKIKDLEGYVFVQKLSAMIDYIEDKEFEKDSDKISYVNRMHAMDSNAIRNKLDSISFGLDTSCVVHCQNTDCEKEIEVSGTICPEFFRPTK